MRIHLAAACVAALTLASGWAAAQSAPSEDDIIAGLRPDAQSLRGPTRGIRPAGTPTAATPAPATPASHGTHAARVSYPSKDVAGGEAPSVDLTVNFVTGSAALTPDARRTLDTLGRALTSSTLASYRFRLEGHTDTVGTAEANQTLSEQRAQAAGAYLELHFGIAGARLDTVGRGESDLAVQTPPQTAEARNRRVKVVNLGG